MTIDMIVSDGKPITAAQAITVFKLFARATGILEDKDDIQEHCGHFRDELKEELQFRRDEVSRINGSVNGEISVAKREIKEVKAKLKAAKTEEEKSNAEMELDDALDELEHLKEELSLAQSSLKELMDDKRQYLVEYVNRNFFDKRI